MADRESVFDVDAVEPDDGVDRSRPAGVAEDATFRRQDPIPTLVAQPIGGRRKTLSPLPRLALYRTNDPRCKRYFLAAGKFFSKCSKNS